MALPTKIAFKEFIFIYLALLDDCQGTSPKSSISIEFKSHHATTKCIQDKMYPKQIENNGLMQALPCTVKALQVFC